DDDEKGQAGRERGEPAIGEDALGEKADEDRAADIDRVVDDQERRKRAVEVLLDSPKPSGAASLLADRDLDLSERGAEDRGLGHRGERRGKDQNGNRQDEG